VQDPLSGQIVGIGHMVGELYEAISMKIPTQTHMLCAAVQSQDVWHSRLGHIWAKTGSPGLVFQV